jgi:hypothetical protein
LIDPLGGVQYSVLGLTFIIDVAAGVIVFLTGVCERTARTVHAIPAVPPDVVFCAGAIELVAIGLNVGVAFQFVQPLDGAGDKADRIGRGNDGTIVSAIVFAKVGQCGSLDATC